MVAQSSLTSEIQSVLTSAQLSSAGVVPPDAGEPCQGSQQRDPAAALTPRKIPSRILLSAEEIDPFPGLLLRIPTAWTRLVAEVLQDAVGTTLSPCIRGQAVPESCGRAATASTAAGAEPGRGPLLGAVAKPAPLWQGSQQEGWGAVLFPAVFSCCGAEVGRSRGLPTLPFGNSVLPHKQEALGAPRPRPCSGGCCASVGPFVLLAELK